MPDKMTFDEVKELGEAAGLVGMILTNSAREQAAIHESLYEREKQAHAETTARLIRTERALDRVRAFFDVLTSTSNVGFPVFEQYEGEP
jgi:hypothetical protein